MSIRSIQFVPALAGMLLVFASIGMASAQPSNSGIVVVSPDQLPTAARQQGSALYLHRKNSDGSVFLYVEQPKTLALFDVTDPSRIRFVGYAPLSLPEPFVFAESLGMDAVVLRSPAGKALGLIDLRKPTAPALRALPEPLRNETLKSLGGEVYLSAGTPTSTLPAAPARTASAELPLPEDYRIYDFSDPQKPVLLAIARQVAATAERPETGTTFLLGSNGLTVVRHPSQEAEFDGWLKQY